jgi:hypothetical protein
MQYSQHKENTMTVAKPMYFIDKTGVTAFVDGEHLHAPASHASFKKIVDKLKAGDVAGLADLFNLRQAVVNFVAGKDKAFTMIGDFLCLDGKPFTYEVTQKVLDMIEAGNAADPIYRFLRKVRQNPLVSAQDELLLFCVANGFMIHEDGDIIAYKSVRGDYKDIHSGRYSNHVGAVVSMDRKSVDADRNRTCSAGLHFAAHGYASTWAGHIDGVNRRLMVMKINPADVVAVPADYNNQKGRTWKYTVIAELKDGKALAPKEVYSTVDLGGKPKPKAAPKPKYTTGQLAVWNDGGDWVVSESKTNKIVSVRYRTREEARQAQRKLYGM